MNEENLYTSRIRATRHDTTPEELAELAESEDYLVRRRVAQNPNTSVETLIRLIEDKDDSVHMWARSNKNTPEIVRTWLDNGGFAGMTLAEFIENVGILKEK
jgi:hypothetical protein